MESKRKKIILLGATGSIGGNTLRVLRTHADKLELVGVSANSNYEGLSAICDEFKVPQAVLTDPAAYTKARAENCFRDGTSLSSGAASLCDLVRTESADIVLIAVVGACGLEPALAAIEAGKDLALANKELLVLGGAFLIELAREKGVRLLPTDSEHNAIFQCLEGRPIETVDQLILTASGGPFRKTPIEDLAQVTPRRRCPTSELVDGKKDIG
jgi:1-deoxy-D-xylulose-5-phosphate reductoisomerase